VITLPELDSRTLLGLGAALLLIATLVLFWVWYRRRRARAARLAAVVGSSFEYQRDILVPDGQGGWVHIDFLLLTSRGCVVIDLRDVAGNIFGGDQMNDWTVMHREQRYTFVNPQTGLYDRIAVVRALVNELPVEGRVIFSPRGRFPKGLPRHTLMLGSLISEFPRVDSQSPEQLLAPWQEDWQRLTAACKPSSLVEPKRAI
jgi:Nuclease-related domain